MTREAYCTLVCTSGRQRKSQCPVSNRNCTHVYGTRERMCREQICDSRIRRPLRHSGVPGVLTAGQNEMSRTAARFVPADRTYCVQRRVKAATVGRDLVRTSAATDQSGQYQLRRNMGGT